MSAERLAMVILAAVVALVGCQARLGPSSRPAYVAPSEFEPQEYIWLTWVERGWLGGPSLAEASLEALRVLVPHVRVRLVFSALAEDDSSFFPPHRRSPAAAEERLRTRLRREGIDMSRVELIFHRQPVGAIQDPGPYFLRASRGGLAVADYRYDHPEPAIEALDRDLAGRLGLPTVPSPLVSEGGGRQVNGHGTLLLTESVELARNPGMSRDDIEREHRRVLGVTRVIWLKQGPADEEWGRLGDGRWGIGTGGHVDVFARFADARTILLAQVDEAQRVAHPIAAETHRRMEENLRLLRTARDQDGQPFRILRVPTPDPMTASVTYDALAPEEQSWFEGAKAGDRIEFYLPRGYLNFIIANGVVVTTRYWREGLPESLRHTDQQAAQSLAAAFPNRRIVQVDAVALNYEGGGLHCYSRNQPHADQVSR
ncbi:agmatine deiminase family protein [Luteitalea sp.]